MRRSNVALRLQPSLLEEVRKVAEAEGVSVNRFITVAVAEKLSALRTEDYFRERAVRADIPRALEILSLAPASAIRPCRATNCRPRRGERSTARNDPASPARMASRPGRWSIC